MRRDNASVCIRVLVLVHDTRFTSTSKYKFLRSKEDERTFWEYSELGKSNLAKVAGLVRFL